MKKIRHRISAIVLSAALMFFSLPFGAFAATEQTSGIYTYTVENNTATITQCDDTASGEIVIPKEIGGYTVTCIGYSAFKGCEKLTGVTFPDTVTSISDYAFKSCSNLSSVAFGKKLDKIGESAFAYCSSLTEVNIPDNVTSLGSSCFTDNSALETVTIGSGLLEIPSSCFYNCDYLKTVNLSNGLKTVGYASFRYCSKLKSIAIPDTVTSIGNYAFRDCSNLSSVAFGKKLDKIGESAFAYCSSLTEVNIPDNVTSVGSSCFTDNSALETVTIGSGLLEIPSSCFNSCNNLKTVNLNNGLKTIGYGSFKNCSKLTDITIPDSVTKIGDYAFKNCSSVSEVYYCGTKEQWDEISVGDGNECLKTANIHYSYSADVTKPQATVVSTNNTAKSQTATLTLKDESGVAGYYWGTNPIVESNTYFEITTVTKEINVSKTVDTAATYYLTVKDTGGNISNTVSITFNKISLITDGGSITPEYIIAQTGKQVDLPTPERLGYTFKGWSKTQNGASVGNTVASENATYYAIWQADIMLGDVNNDGVIDSADAGLILRYDAGLITLTETQRKSADVNGDGSIDSGDSGLILRLDAGVISNF